MERGRIPIATATHGPEEAEAARRVVLSGQLAGGREVAALEEELAALLGVREVVAVANGTAALELALRALGIGPGDEVITTCFSFFATAASILNAAATPVLVDVDPSTGNLDPRAAADAVGPRTAALVPVHLYGRPCDMDALTALARRHGLALIEDACQALGARYAGRPAGTFGVGCFSFHGSKNVGCGEGGAVAVSDHAVARRIRALRNHGSERRHVHAHVSSNLRLSDLQAAVLRVQLTRLDDVTRRRQRLASLYDELLASAAVARPPANDAVYESCYHLYTIRVPRRRRLMEILDRAGVETRVHYPRPIYRQPAWPGRRDALPNAERMAREVLSIPLYPGLTTAQARRIARIVCGSAPRRD